MNSGLRRLLINNLESIQKLDSRYTSLKCINYDGSQDQKRGMFSLVFSARDTVDDVPVALKFYDPAMLGESYRIQAFEREPEILRKLLGKQRCLQIAGPLKVYDLPVPQSQATIPCKYFAAAWIDDDIDKFFQEQEKYDAKTKLFLFNDMVLAVEALHRESVFHRDLKPSNFRLSQDVNRKRVVLAIDMGTAAKYDCPPIMAEYPGPVGDLWYASPETRCGLAGERRIARFTDHYSLGCLLFELFNRELFMVEQLKSGPFQAALAAMAIDLSQKDPTEKLRAWESNVGAFRIPTPSIIAVGNSVPPSIGQELDYLLHKLVNFDFKDRIQNLAWTRQKIWSMIRVLGHQKWQQKKIKEKRSKRALKEKKLLRKQERLRGSLVSKESRRLPC